MSDACFLSPPAGASLAGLTAHLDRLRAMDRRDALVRLAIEDTERLIAERGETSGE
jgi:hypothetical protein